MTNLTSGQVEILQGIACQIIQTASLPLPAQTSKNYTRWAAIENAREGVVQTAPAAWLGRRLGDFEREKIRRELSRFQGWGLVWLFGFSGTRITHVALTPPGWVASGAEPPECVAKLLDSWSDAPIVEGGVDA